MNNVVVKCRIMGISILVGVLTMWILQTPTCDSITGECHGSMKGHVSTNIYSSEAHEMT